MSHIESYIATLQTTIAQLDVPAIDRVVGCLEAAYLRGSRIYICGNGGSASTASHFATDLNKGTTFKLDRHLKTLVPQAQHPASAGAADSDTPSPAGQDVFSTVRRVRAMSLTDNVALMTAWANDTAYEHIFAEQVNALADPDDVLILISGSGNSPNVLHAAATGRTRGMTTVGFTGFNGGKLAHMVDLNVNVPADSIEQVEDVHMALCHMIATNVRSLIRAHYTALAANAGYHNA